MSWAHAPAVDARCRERFGRNCTSAEMDAVRQTVDNYPGGWAAIPWSVMDAAMDRAVTAAPSFMMPVLKAKAIDEVGPPTARTQPTIATMPSALPKTLPQAAVETLTRAGVMTLTPSIPQPVVSSTQPLTSGADVSLLSKAVGAVGKAVGGALKSPIGKAVAGLVPGLGTALAIGSAASSAVSVFKGGGGVASPVLPPPPTTFPRLSPNVNQAGMIPLGAVGKVAGAAGAAVGRAVTRAGGVRAIAKKVFITGAGWFLVDKITGAILGPAETPPRRRMNVLNPRALSRANRRVCGFARAARPILRDLGFQVSATRRSPKACRGKKRRCS